MEDILIEFLEKYKPILHNKVKEAFKVYKGTDNLKDELENTIINYFEDLKSKNIVEEDKHIKIEVTATLEEIEERKYTVTLTALDEYGADIIRKMK